MRIEVDRGGIDDVRGRVEQARQALAAVGARHLPASIPATGDARCDAAGDAFAQAWGAKFAALQADLAVLADDLRVAAATYGALEQDLSRSFDGGSRQ